MAADETCGVHGCTQAAHYLFGPVVRCRWHALTYWPVCRRALIVAAIVGTILLVINQSDVLLAGRLSTLVAAKCFLTYLVPFSVSTYSSLAASRLPAS